MSNSPETAIDTAERILTAILNGNRNDAREELREMKPGLAVAVAAHICEYVHSGERSSVLRLLESCEEGY